MSDKDKQNGQVQPTPPTHPPAPAPPDRDASTVFEGRVREAIKGLKFRTSKTIVVEGEPVRHVQDERPMKRADVLSAVDVNGALVIVSADGRKHRVAA